MANVGRKLLLAPGGGLDGGGGGGEAVALHTRYSYPADGVPLRGAVFFFHGYHAHSGTEGVLLLAQELNEAGFAFFALDHPGHGRSEGRPGLVRWETYLEGMQQYVRAVRGDWHRDRVGGATPYWAVGLSLGGALAVALGLRLWAGDGAAGETFAGRAPDRAFRGAVLLNPAIHTALEPPAPVTWLLRNCLLPLCPGLPLWIRTSPDRVWRDPETAARCQADPLRYSGGMRVASAASMQDLMHRVQEALPRVAFPFCAVLGGQDFIAPATGGEALHAEAATPAGEKRLVVFPEAYHDLTHDPDAPDVRREIVSWLLEQAP